jgi:hypothetical protein
LRVAFYSVTKTAGIAASSDASAQSLHKNGDPEAFLGVADFARYDELFEGRAILDFLGTCLSDALDWDPYCCFLNNAA